MPYRFLFIFCMITLLSPCTWGSPTATKGYALVVTNNRSLSLERPDLHYADDDGIKYAQLFSELLGEKNVVLLTRADAATMRLYPKWGNAAGLPTLGNLAREVARLKNKIKEDRGKGHRVNLYVVFAGHGDLAHGQGFIELADGRLTAQKLESDVIAPLKADRLHLILDSCNSFFMLNPRGKGARRWATPGNVSNTLQEKYPYLGALISTSSEAVTYEWSELQSGIFSYAVRSGLRGAADADGKAGLSYAELEAFISVATGGIKNELYRPRIFVRGPGGNAEALFVSALPGNGVLTIPAMGARRLTIRDGDGVRVLDIHKEDGTAVNLGLPVGSEPLEIYETIQTKDMPRPEILVRNLPPIEGATPLDTLEFQPATYAMRGEAPVFKSLFQQKYGRIAFSEYTKSSREKPAAIYGVSKQQMVLLQNHLELASRMERTNVVQSSVLGLAVGIAYSALGTGMMYTQSDEDTQLWGKITLGVGIAAIVGHTCRLVRPTRLEELHAEFVEQVDDTTENRERAFVETENNWQMASRISRKQRRVGSVTGIIVGSTLTLSAAIFVPIIHRFEDDRDIRRQDYLALGAMGSIGVVLAANGFWWLRHPAPIEQVYDLYIRNSARYRASQTSVQLNALPVAFENGGGLVISGTF